MSYLVHVVSRKPKYGDTEAFNYLNDIFNKLLDNLWCQTSGDDWFADNFECNVEAYKRAIDILKAIRNKKGKDAIVQILKEQALPYDFDDPIEELFEMEEVEDMLKQLEERGLSIDKVITVMEKFLSEADTDGGTIAFACW